MGQTGDSAGGPLCLKGPSAGRGRLGDGLASAPREAARGRRHHRAPYVLSK